MDVTSFWLLDCPERGVSLPHVHWNECATEHDGHAADQCCHCELRASDFREMRSRPPGPMINTAPDRELIGREIDQVVTPQILALAGVVGGFRDPLPVAEKPAVTLCKLCAGEHVTFAVYVAMGEVIGEGRMCAGCIARMIDKSRQPVPQIPATTGHPQEYPQ